MNNVTKFIVGVLVGGGIGYISCRTYFKIKEQKVEQLKNQEIRITLSPNVTDKVTKHIEDVTPIVVGEDNDDDVNIDAEETVEESDVMGEFLDRKLARMREETVEDLKLFVHELDLEPNFLVDGDINIDDVEYGNLKRNTESLIRALSTIPAVINREDDAIILDDFRVANRGEDSDRTITFADILLWITDNAQQTFNLQEYSQLYILASILTDLDMYSIPDIASLSQRVYEVTLTPARVFGLLKDNDSPSEKSVYASMSIEVLYETYMDEFFEVAP